MPCAVVAVRPEDADQQSEDQRQRDDGVATGQGQQLGVPAGDVVELGGVTFFELFQGSMAALSRQPALPNNEPSTGPKMSA